MSRCNIILTIIIIVLSVCIVGLLLTIDHILFNQRISRYSLRYYTIKEISIKWKVEEDILYDAMFDYKDNVRPYKYGIYHRYNEKTETFFDEYLLTYEQTIDLIECIDLICPDLSAHITVFHSDDQKMRED